VQFERDTDFGLPFHLTLVIQIDLIDENRGSPIYRALSVAALLDDAADAAHLAPTVDFFKGDLDSLLDGEHLEAQLVRDTGRQFSRRLEAWRGQQESRGGMVWADLAEGGCQRIPDA
jgi:hypothetical protein